MLVLTPPPETLRAAMYRKILKKTPAAKMRRAHGPRLRASKRLVQSPRLDLSRGILTFPPAS